MLSILGVKYPNPMTFEKASKENHQGIWECSAENSYGESDQKSMEIAIASKTSFKRDSSLTDLVQAHVGQSLSLECAAEVDEYLRDSMKIFWSKDGNVFENDGGKDSYVKNVTDNGLETTGLYECRCQSQNTDELELQNVSSIIHMLDCLVVTKIVFDTNVLEYHCKSVIGLVHIDITTKTVDM